MTVISNAGHRVETIGGDPDHIWQRGTDMTTLGDAMVESADVLQKIKDGDDGSKALSLEDLRDAIGDLSDDLRDAGRSYQRVGPEFIAYGNVLRDGGEGVMKRLNDSAEELLTLWPQRQAAEDAIPTGPSGRVDTEDPEYHDKKVASDLIEEQWDDQSRIYDQAYNSWADAYEAAANNIDEFNDDGIEDSWLDDIHADAIVGALQVVLAFVGVVLVVVGVLAGGPFLAAALILGGVVFALTVYQKARGEAEWGDVAWAFVGALPFGKLGGVVGKAFAGAARLLGRQGGRLATAGRQLRNFNVAVKQAGATRWAGQQLKDLQRWMKAFQGGRFKDPLSRLLFEVDEWSQLRGVAGKKLILPFIGHNIEYIPDINDLLGLPETASELPGYMRTITAGAT